MYLMYIDESGDTQTLQEGGKKTLVLTGCIFNEKDIIDVEKQFRLIKQKYYFNPEIEIKSNFLRYANPEIIASSPIKLHSKEKYNELEKDIAEFLKTINAVLLSAVIDKAAYWAMYPANNPYDYAYIVLYLMFQSFLVDKDGLGLCIIDPRGGTVKKKYIDKDLDKLHNLLRWQDKGLWQKDSRIVERALFSSSEATVGIQIVDLYCYPIFNIFEYNKKKGEYWRFDELTCPKLYAPNDELTLGGAGLKIFPKESKKDFRFFN